MELVKKWFPTEKIIKFDTPFRKDSTYAYECLDRGICMDIMRGYGLGTNLQRLLQRYWDENVVVPKAG